MKTLAINLAVLGGLALAFLAALELWLRATIPASSGESIYEYTMQTRRYKVMRPNARVVAWGKELRTNALGFRDDDDAVPPRQPGEYRIVVLGDSMTVSAGVDFAAIYTSRLERELRRRHPGVRVLNLAVGGYNLLQYALVLEEVGFALEPDLVLIGLVADNDFALDTYEGNYRVASGQQPRPREGWRDALYVYRGYLSRIEARIERLFESPRPAKAADAWRRNEAALEKILAQARARGVPVAAVVLPQNWDYERQQGAFARVAAVCRAHALACLDMRQRFMARGADPDELRLNRLDSHPNDKYNAAVAAELSRFLAGVVPTAPTGLNPVIHSAR